MSCFVDEEVDRHQRHQAIVLVVSHGAHFDSAGVFLERRRECFTLQHTMSPSLAEPRPAMVQAPSCLALHRAVNRASSMAPASGALGTILALATGDGTKVGRGGIFSQATALAPALIRDLCFRVDKMQLPAAAPRLRTARLRGLAGQVRAAVLRLKQVSFGCCPIKAWSVTETVAPGQLKKRAIWHKRPPCPRSSFAALAAPASW